MAWSPPKPTYQTLDDWLATPEDDGNRYELIDGRIVVSPHAGFEHERLASRLRFMLTLWEYTQALGEAFGAVNIILGMRKAVVPDAAILLNAHADRGGGIGIVGAPDVIVEILSPGNRAYDLKQKRDLYAGEGVPEYWIIDPEAGTLTCLVLEQLGVYAEYAIATDWLVSPTIPCLEIDVAHLFAPRPRGPRRTPDEH